MESFEYLLGILDSFLQRGVKEVVSWPLWLPKRNRNLKPWRCTSVRLMFSVSVTSYLIKCHVGEATATGR